MIQLAFNTGRGVDKQKALKTYILEITKFTNFTHFNDRSPPLEKGHKPEN